MSMPIESQGELFSALGRGAYDELIGTEETEWLDFKLTGYQLDSSRQKWELAKDVSAFANSRGGCLVMGVRTDRESHQITDIAIEIRPVAKSVIDPERYLDVIAQWCYPPLRGVTPHWFPRQGPDGIFVLEVPAQPPENRYVIVTRAIGEDDRELNAIMITRREGSRVVTLPPGEVHRLINDGLWLAQAPPPDASEPDSLPDEVIGDLEHAQQWEGSPTLFLQAIPSGSTRLSGFYERDGVRGALSGHVPVRAHVAGFNLRILDDVDISDGALEYLADSRRAMRIDPSGTFTFGALATSAYLAWSTEMLTTPGTTQMWINSIALVETVTEYYRFLHRELIAVSDPDTTWRSRVICRRFDGPPVCLRAGLPTAGTPMLSPPVASASEWEQDVMISDNPEVDAFRALEEIYALFGLPPSAIPLAEDSAISLEQLRAV